MVSRGEAGKKLKDVFPHLESVLINNSDAEFTSPMDSDFSNIDICFFATPHTVAMSQAQSLLNKGIKVIDLSADFRIKDQLIWEQWYATRHTFPELINEAVYGLPELNRKQIKTAKLIACPGCYPTSVQLGLLPILTNDLATDDTIIADVKSGISGGGRSAKTNMLYSERAENFEAYATSGHRHYPEIKQQLEIIAKKEIDLIFTPHLVPMTRGIHSTIYIKLKNKEQNTIDSIINLYKEFYKNEAFVSILDKGKHPQTKSVTTTNLAQIGISNPPNSDYLIIMVVEDNLIKGASGQAVQCMNLMCDFEESLGLNKLGFI